MKILLRITTLEWIAVGLICFFVAFVDLRLVNGQGPEDLSGLGITAVIGFCFAFLMASIVPVVMWIIKKSKQ